MVTKDNEKTIVHGSRPVLERERIAYVVSILAVSFWAISMTFLYASHRNQGAEEQVCGPCPRCPQEEDQPAYIPPEGRIDVIRTSGPGLLTPGAVSHINIVVDDDVDSGEAEMP